MTIKITPAARLVRVTVALGGVIALSCTVIERGATPDGLCLGIVAALNDGGLEPLTRLAHPKRKKRLAGSFKLALVHLKESGIEAGTIELAERKCKLRPNTDDRVSCELTFSAGERVFRIKIAEARKTDQGWRLWSPPRLLGLLRYRTRSLEGHGQGGARCGSGQG